jgi:hypothetical protein
MLESRRYAAKRSVRVAELKAEAVLKAKAERLAERKAKAERKLAVKPAVKPKSAVKSTMRAIVFKKGITKMKKKVAAVRTPATPVQTAVVVERELEFLSSPSASRKRNATPFDVEMVKTDLQAQFAREHYENEDIFTAIYKDIGTLLGQRREYASAISRIHERLAVLERRDEARQRPPESSHQRRRRSRSRSRSRY